MILVAAFGLVSINLAAGCGSYGPSQDAVTLYPVETESWPDILISGRADNLWFSTDSEIGNITVGGRVSVRTRVADDKGIGGMTLGDDGSVWFTEFAGYLTQARDGLGRIYPNSKITEYPLNSSGQLFGGGIVEGPDGAVWFAYPSGNKVGRIDDEGRVTEVKLPGNGRPTIMTRGAGNFLWVLTEGQRGLIRLSMAGDVRVFPLKSLTRDPSAIASGSFGDLWIAECGRPIILHWGPGRVEESLTYPSDDPAPCPRSLVFAHHSLWFIPGAPSILRMDLSNRPVRFSSLPLRTVPQALALGPDGNIWFSESWLNPELLGFDVFWFGARNNAIGVLAVK